MFKNIFLIVSKFKNYCPMSVGSIDVRYDNKNPAELYPNTTWELLSSDKYIRTGTTPLNTGGSNSITISKANLPNVKLKVDSFSVTTQPHNHIGGWGRAENWSFANHAPYGNKYLKDGHSSVQADWFRLVFPYTSTNGGQNTGTASPSTEILGSGTALSIQPSYIILKFWKRLT